MPNTELDLQKQLLKLQADFDKLSQDNASLLEQNNDLKKLNDDLKDTNHKLFLRVETPTNNKPVNTDNDEPQKTCEDIANELAK